MREFNSNQDIFNFATEIISVAKDQGDEETFGSLQSAIHDNFITSEVLGELVVVLEGLLSENSKEYLHPYRMDISEAIRAIRGAFHRANHPIKSRTKR